ncbi:MAG: SgcJ/EcaC family oxidoreductase [Candidatus Acidiferrales bacterium]
MATSNTAMAKTNDETQIRQLIEDWRDALRTRDLDRLMQHYAPDVRFFDAVPPYQHRGAAAYRRTWELMLPHLPPTIGVELCDLEISVSGDLAVMRCLTRIMNEETKQDATCGWVRVTVCYERQQGTWRVIHEHVSVPFDPATSQAAFIREP